jgi:alkylated DNA nucleotide flippase Atl1
MQDMMMMKRNAKLAIAAAICGAAVATTAACGSDTTGNSSTPSSAANAAVSSKDMVTAIPSLHGDGTSVILNADTVKALTGLGVTVKPYGSASFDSGAGTITFPITSGYAEIHSDHAAKPGWIQGSIEHDGSGFTLTAGSTTVLLHDFVVDPGHSILYGTVGSGSDAMYKVPLLSLDGSNVQVTMPTGKVQLYGTVAKLTDTAASALNSAFKTSALKAGIPLGVVRLVADATGAVTFPSSGVTAIPRLDGVATDVIADKDTLAALKSLGVAVAPNGSGTFDSSTATLGFPITGGYAAIHSDKSVKPGYVQGVVLHQGSGLTFSKGSTSLALTNFVVDPGNSILTGTVGGKVGVPLLSLDGSKLEITMPNGDVQLYGTVAKLTTTAASALNSTFGVSAFKAGMSLGTVKLVAHAQG